MGLLKISSIYKSRRNNKDHDPYAPPSSSSRSTTASSTTVQNAPKIEPLSLNLDFDTNSSSVPLAPPPPAQNNNNITSASYRKPIDASAVREAAPSSTTTFTNSMDTTNTTAPAGPGASLFDDIFAELKKPVQTEEPAKGKNNSEGEKKPYLKKK